MQHKIIVQEHENPTGMQGMPGMMGLGGTRTFHASLNISLTQGVCYQKFPFTQGGFMDLDERTPVQPKNDVDLRLISGEEGHRIAQEILTIEGVLSLMLQPYSIDVEKAACFEWQELSPAITKVLLAFFKRKGITDVQKEMIGPTPFEETPQGKAQAAQVDFFQTMARWYEQHGGD